MHNRFIFIVELPYKKCYLATKLKINKHINIVVIADINFHVVPYCQVRHSEFVPKLVHFFLPQLLLTALHKWLHCGWVYFNSFKHLYLSCVIFCMYVYIYKVSYDIQISWEKCSSIASLYDISRGCIKLFSLLELFIPCSNDQLKFQF